MNRTVLNFEEMVARVMQYNNFSLILEKQFEKYDLQPYKIQQCEALNMLKIYKIIENKQIILDSGIKSRGKSQSTTIIGTKMKGDFLYELDKKEMPQRLWEQLSDIFFFKKPQFLEFQYLNLLKAKKRISWTTEEDNLLIESIKLEKAGKWNQISKKMFYISNRTIFRSPKHCRERWLNHLDVNKKHGDWSQKEDLVIFKFICESGKKWSKVVPLLNETRTEHMIKNRYNSLISKNKSSKKQKQEDIASKIYRQLLRDIQNEQSLESKSASGRNQNPVSEQKVESEIGQTALRQNLSQNQQNRNNFISVGYPSAFNYPCYFDYNALFLMNQLYCPPTYTQNHPIPLDTQSSEQQFLFSKNSSFTPYIQNA